MVRAKPTLSVLGLYQWDEKLFELLELPGGFDPALCAELILLECAELESRFTDWNILHGAIGVWSKSRKHEWDRIARTLMEDYNPLHNFDRHEEWEEDGSGNSENILTVNGFNNEAQHDRTNSSAKGNTKHKGHLYGNLGVTESTTMAKNELEFRKTDFYNIIVQEFKERYCILVY